jgi:hypothetical protein
MAVNAQPTPSAAIQEQPPMHVQTLLIGMLCLFADGTPALNGRPPGFFGDFAKSAQLATAGTWKPRLHSILIGLPYRKDLFPYTVLCGCLRYPSAHFCSVETNATSSFQRRRFTSKSPPTGP